MVKDTGGEDAGGKNGEGLLRLDRREPDDESEEMSWGGFFQILDLV